MKKKKLEEKMNNLLVNQLWPFVNSSKSLDHDAFNQVMELFENNRAACLNMYCGAFLSNLAALKHLRKSEKELKLILNAFNKCSDNKLPTYCRHKLVTARKEIKEAYKEIMKQRQQKEEHKKPKEDTFRKIGGNMSIKKLKQPWAGIVEFILTCLIIYVVYRSVDWVLFGMIYR